MDLLVNDVLIEKTQDSELNMTKYIIVAKFKGERFVVGNKKKLSQDAKELLDFDPISLSSNHVENFFLFSKFIIHFYVDALRRVENVTDVCIKEVKFDIDFDQ